MIKGRRQRKPLNLSGKRPSNLPRCVRFNETVEVAIAADRPTSDAYFPLAIEDGSSDESDNDLLMGQCMVDNKNYWGENTGEDYSDEQLLEMMLGESCECNDFMSIPTNDNKDKKGPQSRAMCLDQISLILRKLDSEPNQFKQHENICKLWKKYLRRSPSGVNFKDFPKMIDIFYVLNDQHSEADFTNPLMDMMTGHLKKMLQYDILSDLLDLHYLTTAFVSMGYLIISGTIKTQSRLVEIFLYWIERFEIESFDARLKNVQSECNPTMKNSKLLPKENFMAAVENSSIPRQLAKAIIDKTLNDATYINILEILKFVCENSPIVWGSIVRRPILEPILEKLDEIDDTCILLSRTIDFIYALFGKHENKLPERGIPHPSANCVQKLLVRFVELMHWSESKFLVQLRNDAVFSIYLLVKHIPTVKRNFSAFASYICEIVSTSILEHVHESRIHIQLDSTQEGLEMIKHLLSLITIVIGTSYAKSLILDFSLVPVFMKIIHGSCALLKGLSQDNYEYAQLIEVAWQGLSVIAKVEPLAFTHPDGVSSMLALLHTFSKHGTVDRTLLFKLTQILRMILSHKPAIMTKLGKHLSALNAITVFVDVLKHITVNSFSISEEPIVCNILLSISRLCESDENNKELFCGAKGIRVIARFMTQLVLHPAADRHMNPLIHISVSECIWKSIAFSTTCLEMFLAYEGVLLMLDLLEVAAGPSVILHLLSCLLDLCEYPRCMDQLLHWKRSKRRFTNRHSHGEKFNQHLTKGLVYQALQPAAGDQIGDYIVSRDETLAALLCELWSEEEKRLGVLRDSVGCIASIEKPLMGDFARNFTSLWKLNTKGRIKPSELPGPSCLDLFASIRPKIFLMVKNITDSTNTEATIFGGLSINNQVTMQIIINFLDLKRGELWVEMIEELKDDQVKLVESDEHAMEIFHKIGRNKVAAVLDTQQYLIRRAKEHDEITENEFYNLMKECVLQDHLVASRAVQQFARSCNYVFMVEKRLWHLAQLKNYVLNDLNPETRLHRTSERLVNCTAWPGGTKVITSEPHFSTDNLSLDLTEVESTHLSEKLFSKLPLSVQTFHYLSEAESTKSLYPTDDLMMPSMMDIRAGASTVDSVVRIDRLNVKHGSAQYDSKLSEKSDDETPPSAEDGFYQISPILLRKLLTQLQADQKKWNVDKILDDENAWMMRSKWKSDWYPAAQMHI